MSKSLQPATAKMQKLREKARLRADSRAEGRAHYENILRELADLIRRSLGRKKYSD